jgi:hypothetical protein
METLTPPKHALELFVFWTWMGDDGICRTKTKPDAVVNLKEAVENSMAVDSFYEGKKFPILIDARQVKSMAKEARAHFSTNGRKTNINAMAIMVKSPLSRVIGNFFMGLNKPPVPAKLFDDESEAVIWCKQFVQ